MPLPSPDTITNEEFTGLLNEYPSLVETISKSKGSKPGQKTLQQLDEYRYGQAIAEFGSPDSKQEMTLENVKLLVEWKLRHGKFRPMLMGLAASNNAAVAKNTIAEAIATYRAGPSPSDKTIAATLAMLAKLRGIGPATASLLLTVHDPTRIVFFSDEVFYWLCCDGRVDKIKYTNPEYEQLRKAARVLMARLNVSATDVEKVAYVLFKRNDGAAAASAKLASAPNPSVKVAKAEQQKEIGERKEGIEGQKNMEKLDEMKEKKEQAKKKTPAKLKEDNPDDAKSEEPRPTKRKGRVSEKPHRTGSRQSKRIKK
ncbi:hypothetical protein NQ176_g3157 [Zarea fungicola]|uniref:Uncharacterized protein n=1 Tax=Zarea fungicola TaxID=93591 RepID=A0ACC1NLY1_9HYPO|nr:hypothetical protein NQ176_g3157 [Lecanicillium fungicola]